MKTETRKMTITKFAEYAKAEADALAASPNADRSALLRVNLAKAGAVVDDAEIEVEVALAEEAPPALDLTEIAAKLDKIDAAVAAFASGVTAKAMFDAVVAKQAIAVQLATELLSAYQAKVAALAAQLQAGGEDLDREKVWDALCSYNIESAVMDALTTLGKAEGADVAAQTEVGGLLKAALTTRTEADATAKAEAEAAAKKAAEELAAKAGTCEQCGAKMEPGNDVCPECGWKLGEPVSKRAGGNADAYDAPRGASFPIRFTGK